MKSTYDPRHRVREEAFKLIFKCLFNSNVLNKENVQDNGSVNEFNKINLINGVNRYREIVDSTILSHSSRNTTNINHINKVDLAILELAVYELLYLDTPKIVVIDEAIEIAKKYGSDSSSSYINGVLANIVKENNEKTK